MTSVISCKHNHEATVQAFSSTNKRRCLMLYSTSTFHFVLGRIKIVLGVVGFAPALPQSGGWGLPPPQKNYTMRFFAGGGNFAGRS